jgi:hypothetical protein
MLYQQKGKGGGKQVAGGDARTCDAELDYHDHDPG